MSAWIVVSLVILAGFFSSPSPETTAAILADVVPKHIHVENGTLFHKSQFYPHVLIYLQFCIAKPNLFVCLALFTFHGQHI